MSFFPVWWIFNGAFPIGCRWASFGAMPSKGGTYACSGVKSRTMLRVFMSVPYDHERDEKAHRPSISKAGSMSEGWSVIGKGGDEGKDI